MEQLHKNVEVRPSHTFNGNYLGMVVSDEDPNDWGRVKVRIIGIHSEFNEDESGSDGEFEFLNAISDEDLPWAQMALSITRSGGENSISNHGDIDAVQEGMNSTGTGGHFNIPRIGTHVWVFFHNGHHMHPKIFAMAPQKMDWVAQKNKLKTIIDNKQKQIEKFNPKFKPVGTPVNGTDWASNASVNVQGDKVYDDTSLGLFQHFQTKSDKKWTNAPNLDIRSLRDKENFSEDLPYEEDQGDKGKQTMRNVECFTSRSGTTIIIDRTDGEETMYKIHKNFMQVIDQNGSRKVFIGRNDDLLDEKILDDKDAPVNPDIRCNDERNVDGDVKDHILGNWNTYVKGMKNIQVDKCVELDINESLGVVVRKGDIDIIVQGLGNTGREDESTHTSEGGKASDWNGAEQRGSINIDVQTGDIEMHVGRNINLHVDNDVNLKVDGDLKAHVGKDYHLKVDGDYVEDIAGSKTSKIGKGSEVDVGKHLKETIGSSKDVTVGGSYKIDVSSTMDMKMGGAFNSKASAVVFTQSSMTVASSMNVTQGVSSGGMVSGKSMSMSTSLVIAGTELKDHKHVGNHGKPTPLITGGGGATPTPTFSTPVNVPSTPSSGGSVKTATRDTK